jgi:hypothetical protein
MLLDEISVHDPDFVTVKCEENRKITDERGFPASALLASDGYDRHN